MRTNDDAKWVYVCSPYRATSDDPVIAKDEISSNVERAVKACRILSFLGYRPIAPHLYMTRFLRDSDEREREMGMRMGMEWLELCDLLYVWGDRVSEGMAKEIAYATELNIPVVYMPEPCNLVEAILTAFKHEGELQQKNKNNTEGAADGTEMEN